MRSNGRIRGLINAVDLPSYGETRFQRKSEGMLPREQGTERGRVVRQLTLLHLKGPNAVVPAPRRLMVPVVTSSQMAEFDDRNPQPARFGRGGSIRYRY